MKRALIRIFIGLILLVGSIIILLSGLRPENEYTVSFYTDNGTPQPAVQYVRKNDYATRPKEDPQKDGYTFVGWYLNGKKYVFEMREITEDIVIFAYYESTTSDTYKVVFNVDGKETQVTIEDGKPVSKPADPTKEGYDFTGWYLGDKLYDFNTPVERDTKLEARFEIKKFTVTIDFDNGDDLLTASYNWGQTVTKPDDPEKGGYTFVGWYVGDDEYDFTTPVADNITITAHYQIKTFDVTIDPDNGDDVVVTTYNWNETVTKPADPTKEGYDFIGWYYGDELFDFNIPVTEDFMITARYEIKVFEVEIDPSNNGGLIVIDYYNWGQTVPQPADPTWEGHTFIGWYVNGVLYDFNTPVTNDLVIVAQYEILTFDVTIDYDNGDNPLVESYNWGQTVTKPADPTKEGHSFSGWYLGDDEYDFTTPVTADITITAHYTILNFEVEYDPDNGDPFVYEFYDWNQTVTKPADPVKEGHDFVAWYLGNDEYDFTTPLTTNITLTAHYQIKTFQVEIDPANGDPIIATKYDWNQTITKPADPIKEGYEFIGWYLGTDEYDFTTPVTSDIRLTAHYEILTFTITFDPRDGSVPTDITYDYNQLVTPPTLATRNLFTFEYWETIDEVQIDFSQPVNQTITVYPFWSAEVTDTDELLAALTEARDGDYIFITASFTLTADVEIDVAVKIDGEDNTIIRSGFAFSVNNADAEVVNLTLV